ncbi:MAG TPA: DUF3455 domain-containing protein [Aliidongia sp.]|uniref:DUF3455 domain-containing protein n=1 Tax=Aliidongia sp. TaxID=1914230 RepID=UPI002DDDA05B|nr:DUF3455 domain-containing protein [Aliidongia sp.]HEV2674836.1 DUF3455 domain-containing protein [Aliidongia sp.]
MIGRRFICSLAAVLLLLAGSGAAEAAKPVPAELQIAGATLVLTTEAKGVQIYKSVADADGHFKWMLEAPLARLATRGKPALYHYVGPSWESPDGSKVVRDTDAPVKSVAAPDAAADIPWLLLKVTADPAPGVLSKVGFVQRIETHGGQPPSAAPIRVDTRIGVPYTATYRFYAKAP